MSGGGGKEVFRPRPWKIIFFSDGDGRFPSHPFASKTELAGHARRTNVLTTRTIICRPALRLRSRRRTRRDRRRSRVVPAVRLGWEPRRFPESRKKKSVTVKSRLIRAPPRPPGAAADTLRTHDVRSEHFRRSFFDEVSDISLMLRGPSRPVRKRTRADLRWISKRRVP